MDELENDNFEEEVQRLRAGIREIAHEINNPLGVLRMAAYLMETTNPDEAKRKHYVGLINTSVDRIEQGLKQLQSLRDNPSGTVPTSTTTSTEQP